MAWAVGDAGTILRTSDRGETWQEITNDVITSLGSNSLANGRRLSEVNLRAVRHFQTSDVVLALDGTQGIARMVIIVGDYNSILRYDPCAVRSEGSCFEQSAAWIDMSISNYEDFYGHLYDVHLFNPTTPTRTDAQTPPLAFAVGQFLGRDGINYPYTQLSSVNGQLVVLRLTPHGQQQPQNSPHGWATRSTFTCNDPNGYGCWTLVTPPWTEGQDYEVGFSQNQASADEIPTCCTASSVRCVFPDDFLACYPWPQELAVRLSSPPPQACIRAAATLTPPRALSGHTDHDATPDQMLAKRQLPGRRQRSVCGGGRPGPRVRDQ